MANATKPRYRCSQSMLYAAAMLIIDSLELYLSFFTALKAKYTASYVTGLRTKTAHAQALPNAQARSSQAEAKLVELGEKNETVCDLWQRLKRYIEAAFPKAQHKALTEQAGGLLYSKASRGNWEDTMEMGETAKLFMTANSASLQAGGTNMPATFEADFAAALADMVNTYTAFMHLKQGEEGTEDKIDANNELYADIIEICEDGQLLFKKDSGKRERFVFNSVLEAITPPGAASLRVFVQDGATYEPLAGVVVVIQQTGQPALEQTTDTDGDVIFESIEPGDYRYTISKAGYGEQQGVKEVKVGVNARMEIRLTAV